MEADRIRTLKSLTPYLHLFPKAQLRDTRIKRGAVLEDTIQFIPLAVKRTSWQVEAYVKQELSGLSLYEACKKLWFFIYEHIQYKKDEQGHEQIRSPARLIHDRIGDCDCFTTTISACLTVLKVRHILRVAKYDPTPQGRFQHIYPIVPLSNGRYITIDCVLNEFNKEQPYVEVKDTKMDLEFLDGIEEETVNGTDEVILGLEGDIFAMEGLYGEDDLGFLKKFVNKAKNKFKSVAKSAVKIGGNALSKGANIAGKGLHYLNKFNPATVLLRNGLLATLKLNMMNVASNLKWSYLSPQEASKRNINISKFNKLKGIREKLESIFYGAGGDKSNFKKAILTGKGNAGRQVVAGLDGLESVDFSGLEGLNEYSTLYQLLGPEIFYSENLVGAEDLEGLEREGFEIIEGLEGLSEGEPLIGLGEPATASIAAATGAIATVATLIKNLGNIFDTGKKVVQSVAPPKSGGTSAPPEQVPVTEYQTPVPTEQESPNPAPTASAQVVTDPSMVDPSAIVNPSQSVPAVSIIPNNNVAKPAANTTPAAQDGFWNKNKTWLKPTLIGATGLGVAYIGYRFFSSGNHDSKPAKKKQEDLSGINRGGRGNNRIKNIKLS